MILNEEQIGDAADAIAEITNRDGLTNRQMATLKTHLRGLIVSVLEEPHRFRGEAVEVPEPEPSGETRWKCRHCNVTASKENGRWVCPMCYVACAAPGGCRAVDGCTFVPVRAGGAESQKGGGESGR